MDFLRVKRAGSMLDAFPLRRRVTRKINPFHSPLSLPSAQPERKGNAGPTLFAARRGEGCGGERTTILTRIAVFSRDMWDSCSIHLVYKEDLGANGSTTCYKRGEAPRCVCFYEMFLAIISSFLASQRLHQFSEILLFLSSPISRLGNYRHAAEHDPRTSLYI